MEICADSVESAIAAERGGASRIELCSDLLEGGITPSAGMISSLRRKLGIDLFVMIRPRGGDFCYTAAEFEIMQADIVAAKQIGANGVVLGLLKEDGSVDISRTRQLVDFARPLQTTFHRAFDMSRNLHESLEAIIEAGADRILTSGGEQNVEDGLAEIKNLTRQAAGRIAIMAGAGITESNVREIVQATGVREIHASLRAIVPSPMLFRNQKVSLGSAALGSAAGREYHRAIVLEERVRLLVERLNAGCHASAPGQI